MTRSTLPSGPEVPESTLAALHALYREAASAEPGPGLDRSILAAARAELNAGRAAKARKPAPWWKRWLPLTSALAMALVGLSVTWRVMDEQERHLREEMKAAEAAGETLRAPPAPRSTEAGSSISAVAPVGETSRRVESDAAKDAPRRLAGPAAPPAATATATAPAEPAPMPGKAMEKGLRAGPDELRERRDAPAVAAPAASPAPARALMKLEARSPGPAASGAGAADSIAPAAVDAATPEAWLKHVRELRAAGRSAEAAQSLARFRLRYPDFVLPDDLLNLK